MGVGARAVSPFCMGNIPVYVDDLLLGLRTIFVNGGVPEVDIEVAPAKLIEATGARVGHYRQGFGQAGQLGSQEAAEVREELSERKDRSEQRCAPPGSSCLVTAPAEVP